MKPVRLLPRFVERVWGTRALAPWFPDAAVDTGEVWLTSDENETSTGGSLRTLMERGGEAVLGRAVRPAFGGRFPILVKFLFTREKLSVQVHPDDVYGEAHEGSPGKTEMWYVLRAEADSTIAAGFRAPITAERLRESVRDGSVEGELKWWPAKAGQAYFVPARTVHAVGAGVVICEIQQNSDVTYRLWDYGRPRELHVEPSLAVAELGPHEGPVEPAGDVLASCPYFRTERVDVDGELSWRGDGERFHLLVVTRGEGHLAAEGESWPVRAGECWLAPAACGEYGVSGSGVEILRVYVPG